MEQALTLAAVAELVGGTLHGADPERTVHRAASLEGAQSDALTFCSGDAHRQTLASTQAGLVLLPEALLEDCPVPAVVVSHPYAAYARAASRLHPPKTPAAGVHATAAVSPDAVLGERVSVGPQAVVEAGVHLEDGVVIGPGCWIGEDAVIGEATRLTANVSFGPRCRIGARGILHAGVVVGADGFGFAPDENGEGWLKVPQLGAVRMEDDVELGAGVTIDRGAHTDTVIETGVKLDDQVHIAHNVHVGTHTVIAGATVVAGSTWIGRYCVIGGLCAITGHIGIADGTTILGMTGVTHSIRERGTYASPLPARPVREWRKNTVRFTQLDDLFRRVQALERQQPDPGSGDA